MSQKPRRGLGRSLEALLGDIAPLESTNVARLEGSLKQLSLAHIQKGKYQPRQNFDEKSLAELADSIRAQGIIQPIVVRSLDTEKYEIIAGERRFRAAQLAGLETIPVLVRELPDEAALAVALIENLQRQDLNPIEEAQALKRLIEEFELTHEQVAHAVGKSRAAVSNLLRLLNLSDEVKYLIEQGQLDMGHARALLSLPEQQQTEIAKLVVLKGLSVREAEQIVKNYVLNSSKSQATSNNQLSTVQQQAVQQLAKKLNLKINLKESVNGSGKLIFHYKNITELQKILYEMG